MTRTPYQQYIRECFAQAYQFLDAFKHPRTGGDWDTISAECGKRADTYPLMVDLIAVALKELEREYNAAVGREG